MSQVEEEQSFEMKSAGLVGSDSAVGSTPATPVTPATPATPVTPATPATPVTPATPAAAAAGKSATETAEETKKQKLKAAADKLKLQEGKKMQVEAVDTNKLLGDQNNLIKVVIVLMFLAILILCISSRYQWETKLVAT